MSNTAILLAAGHGTRMGGPVPKQYMDLSGIPLAARSLAALGSSDVIDDIVLVIPDGDEAYVREHILPAAGQAARKVRAFAPGGAERYLSVLSGIDAIAWDCGLVFIHDAARPFIDRASLARLAAAAESEGTAVAGMPSKDTVKITDADDCVVTTPDRSRVWIVQTPQVFDRALITEAYHRMRDALEAGQVRIPITDDAMVVEQFLHRRVRLVEATYRNIKVTTPEDLLIAEAFLAGR